MIAGVDALAAALRREAAAKARPRHLAEGVVARVGDRVVTEAALRARLAAIYRGPMAIRLPSLDSSDGARIRRWAAQLLVSEALVLGEAARLGLAVPPCPDTVPPDVPVSSNGADAATERAVMAAVAALFAHVTAHVTVSEEAIRRYYEANLDLFTRPEYRMVRQAVLATADEALALARDHSARDRLGAAEVVARGEMPRAFEEAVFRAPVGSLVGPVHTLFGWHVVWVESASPGGVTPLSEVRRRIEEELLAAARGTAFDDWLTRRRAALVTLADGYEHPGDPSLPDVVHRH